MRQGTAQSTDRVNKGTDFIHSFNLRARSPGSLLVLSFLLASPHCNQSEHPLRYSACTAIRRASQSKAPHRTGGRAQFVLHHAVTVIACANRPNVQPVGRSIKWLVRATAAQAGTSSAGPGWPCFQWLPPRWVASPFIPFFCSSRLLPVPALVSCSCKSQSRAPEGGV